MSRALNSLSFFLVLLVFRLTGDDAVPLRASLQERMPQNVDFKKIKYFGDLNSLACSEKDDCFLWLSRLEWESLQNEGQSTRLAFTLPFRETALKGLITLEILPTSERNIGLQFQDVTNVGVLDFVDPSTGASLQFYFSSDIAQTVKVETDGIPAGTCPISTKVGTDLRCTVFYNWKGAFDVYPLGKSVQGVAVGWGVAFS